MKLKTHKHFNLGLLVINIFTSTWYPWDFSLQIQLPHPATWHNLYWPSTHPRLERQFWKIKTPFFQLYWYTKDIWFFQCKIQFYFTQWTPKAVFSWVAVATSENTSFGIMNEIIKIRSFSEKIKFAVSFMLLFTISFHMLFHSRQKTNFFSNHFASISSCSDCLGGIILGENTVLHLENEPK